MRGEKIKIKIFIPLLITHL